jgi:hypothetical protein
VTTSAAPPTVVPTQLRAPELEPEPLRAPLRNAPQAAPIDEATFRETLAFLVPNPDEMKWASIPWQTDLWEARKLAREANKPIFMWSMNGNPLGCV